MSATTGYWVKLYSGSADDGAVGEESSDWIKVPALASEVISPPSINTPEPATWLSWTLLGGGMLTIAGVGLALGEKALERGALAEAWIGELAALASAFCGASCAVLYRPYLRRYPPLLVVLPLLVPALPAAAEDGPVCAKRDQYVDFLKRNRNETREKVALVSERTLLEFFVSPAGTWTSVAAARRSVVVVVQVLDMVTLRCHAACLQVARPTSHARSSKPATTVRASQTDLNLNL